MDVFLKPGSTAPLLVLGLCNYVALVRLQPYYSASFTDLRAGLLMASIVGSIIALASAASPTAYASIIVLAVSVIPSFMLGQVISRLSYRRIVSNALFMLNKRLHNNVLFVDGSRGVLRSELMLAESVSLPKTGADAKGKSGSKVPGAISGYFDILAIVRNSSTKLEEIFASPFDIEICARFIFTCADPAGLNVMHKIFEMGREEWTMSGLIEVDI